MQKILILVFFGISTLISLSSVTPAAAKRLALVIGNDEYVNVTPLKKAVNDAKSLAVVLEKIGFQVIININADRRTFDQQLNLLNSEVNSGDEVVFFYAGHGISVNGRNYLLPVDIPAIIPGHERSVTKEAFSEDEIINILQAKGAKVSILIIDACRNNPFPKEGTRSVGRSVGLGQRDNPPINTFVIYSAGIGQEALDRLSDEDENPNSVFTRRLLPLIQQVGLSHVRLAKTLQIEVEQLALSTKSNHPQFPAFYDQVRGDFYFVPKDIDTPETMTKKLAVATPPVIESRDAKLQANEALLGLTLDDIENLRVVAEIEFQVEQPGRKSHDELRAIVSKFNEKNKIDAGNYWNVKTQVEMREAANRIRKSAALATQDLIKIAHSARALAELGFMPKTRKKVYSNGISDQSYMDLKWAFDVLFDEYPRDGEDLKEAIYSQEFIQHLKKYQREKNRSHWQGYLDPLSLEELSSKSLKTIAYTEYNTYYRDNLQTRIVEFNGTKNSYWTFADWTYFLDKDIKSIPETRCAIYFSTLSNTNDIITPVIAYNPSKNKRRINDRFHIFYFNYYSAYNNAALLAKKAIERGYLTTEEQQKFLGEMSTFAGNFSVDGKDKLVISVDDEIVYRGKDSFIYDQKVIDKIITAFRKGQRGSLQYWSAYTGKIEEYGFNLNGFSQAYKYALSKRCP